MNIKDAIALIAIDKLSRLVLSSVIRAVTHPIEHRRWCKSHPKSMALVEQTVREIKKKATEDSKGG